MSLSDQFREAMEARDRDPDTGARALPSGSVEPMTEERLAELRATNLGPYAQELLAEVTRLRSAGDEAGRRLREALGRLRKSAEHVIYCYDDGLLAPKGSNAIDRLRAALSSSGTTETSRARAEAERFGENRERSTASTTDEGDGSNG